MENITQAFVVEKCIENRHNAARAVVSLLTFYEKTPLNKRDTHIAKSIKAWAEKGNEIDDNYFTLAKEICQDYAIYLHEIWLLKIKERDKNRTALEFAKQSVEEGYGTLD